MTSRRDLEDYADTLGFTDAFDRDLAIRFGRDMAFECLTRCLQIAMNHIRAGKSGIMQGMHEAGWREQVGQEIFDEMSALVFLYENRKGHMLAKETKNDGN